MEERLNETIENICDWIDEQLIQTSSMQESNIIPLTISALAKLVTARAELAK